MTRNHVSLRPFQPAGGGHADMGARWQHLSRVNGSGLIHRQDAERLIALLPLHAFAYQPGSLMSGLVPVAAKHCHMQQNVGPAIVGDNEAIAFRSIEPLDDAADLDKVGRLDVWRAGEGARAGIALICAGEIIAT